jgi:hypothetical protein
MTIKSIEDKHTGIEIDLTGPDGNAFALMATAKSLTKLLNERRGNTYLDWKEIQADMMSGDYDHLLEVMEKHFGHIITMYK